MTKTNFAHGTMITPEFLNAINNPTYSADPQEDGEIPYPDLLGAGVTGAINIAVGNEQNRAMGEEGALADRLDALEAAAATKAGSNHFSGANSFAKVFAHDIASVGGPDAGSIPSTPLDLNSPSTYKLVGYIIFLTGDLSGISKRLSFLISNPSAYTWGVSVPLVKISVAGVITNHGSGFEYLTSVKLAEIIWDGATVWVRELSA